MPDVSVREISKAFATVRAVDRVTIDFHAGEIHAVLGENGAGKSTLMHLLAGLYRPDSGEILIAGQPRTIASPRAAHEAGIAMVHQHFMLVPTLSIAENILFALPGSRYDVVHRATLTQRIRQLGIRYGMTIEDPSALVASLSVGAQQRVEILKTLAADARVLILDEPTAVLTPEEVEQLFRTLRQLRRDGYLIILITHKIPEVLAISDRLSVLRNGRLVTTRETATCTANELASLMVGETLLPVTSKPPQENSTRPAALPGETPTLALTKVSLRNEQGRIALNNVSLSVMKHEIVGIAGVAGNGQTELAELLIGLRAPTCGTMHLFGHPVTVPTPTRLRTSGIALIPQDRQREGLALPLTIEENLLLSATVLEKQAPGILLSPKKVRHFATTQMSRFQIRTTSSTQPVSFLSGGNQQRVVIARELASNPQILVAANPTRGLDVGATRYVHQTLLECCARGAGIVLISTDLDEIFALSTRMYTLYQGKLLGPVEPTVGRTQLGRMMTGTWAPP